MTPGVKEQIGLTRDQPYRLLRWKESFQDMALVVSPDKAISVAGGGDGWHYHRAFQLTLFTRGTGTRFVGNHIAPFYDGDLVLLGENLPHYWHAEGKSAGLSIQWSFAASHPFWMFAETTHLVSPFERAARGIHFRGGTAQEISTVMFEMTENEQLGRLGSLFRIFNILANAPSREQTLLSSKTFSLPVESRHLGAMQAAVQFLLTHYRNEVHLDELLEVTHMSKATFSRVFKSHSGNTLSQFLQHLRLDAASRELAQSDNPVIEVALNCGFTQVSFFNRVFKRNFKCSPTDYRAQNRPRLHNVNI